MHVMDEAEYRRFLTEGTRTGKLATTRADGRPHVAPVWFDLDDDGTVVLTTGADSVKGKALRREPRVCLCVDDETPPYSFVVINGIAEITEDPGPLLEWAIRIAGRYMDPERARRTVGAMRCPASCWCGLHRTTSWPRRTSPTDFSPRWQRPTRASGRTTRAGPCTGLSDARVMLTGRLLQEDLAAPYPCTQLRVPCPRGQAGGHDRAPPTDGLRFAVAPSALRRGLEHTIELRVPRAWVRVTCTQPAVQVGCQGPDRLGDLDAGGAGSGRQERCPTIPHRSEDTAHGGAVGPRPGAGDQYSAHHRSLPPQRSTGAA
jgi:PPOX class probable F420-dependent enzyme